MSKEPGTPTVSLHRFHDHAALAIVGTGGGTVYLTAKNARRLSRDLARLCRSLERESFSQSQYRQDSVPCADHAN